MLLAVLLVGVWGCSKGGNGGGTNNGTGPETYNVTVDITVQGAGTGHGQVSGNQISCQVQGGQAAASGCSGSMTMNSVSLPANYTVTATAASGSEFVGWGGACSSAGSNGTCQVQIPKSKGTKTINVTAEFDMLPGAVEVTTETTGSELDPDGYSVAIGTSATGTIDANEVKTFSNLEAGDYEVTLSGVADNCTVAGNNPRTLSVTPGNTTPTTFSVTCVPTKGSIEVTTVTQGNPDDLDDGYTVAIGAAAATVIGINATETYAQLAPGDHAVTLGDIAPNCTLDDGDNPRTLTVVAGQTTQTTFNLTCAPTTGSIQVTTVTQGDAQDLDPDGYTVTIGQVAATAIGINATETYTPFQPGVYSVTLGDIDGTCRVTGENPASATVVAGQTVEVTFNITCGAQTGIKVTTFINGIYLPTTLTVAINAEAPVPIGANTTLEFSPLPPGAYDVFLAGIPKTCLVGEPNPKTFVLNAGEMATAFFVLQCVPPNGIAFEQVSPRGDIDICVLDPYVDNPVPLCLTGGPGDTADDVHPVWGPNQEWILFSSDRDGDFELYKMDADGTNVIQLTDNTFFDGEPDVYFSGIKAIFTSDRSGNKDIWEMDLTQPGYPVTQFTTHTATDWNPTYFWDSGTWGFSSQRDGDWDIWRGGPGPGNVGQQTISDHNDDDVWYLPPNLFYSSDRFGTWDVIKAPNGLPAQKLFGTPAIDKHPAPGPLGRWVAFTTNKDGNYELYKMDLVSLEVVRLTNNGVADTRPAWYAYWH